MILDRYDPIGARIYDGISQARPDWYQNFEAGQRNFMRVDSVMSRRFGLQGVWSDITSRLNEELGDRYMRLGSATGGSFPDPTRYFGTSDAIGNGDARYVYEATQIIDQVLQLELDNPGLVPQDILSLMNMQAIEDRMREEAMASREDLMRITEQSRGTGGFARFMGALSAGMYEFTQDPLQVVTLFYGNSRILWKFAAQQAALNASIEVMRQPQVAQWYGELGLEYTAEQFYTNVAVAGAAGSAFAVGFRGIGAAAGTAKRNIGPAVDRLRVGRDVAIFTRALDEAQPDMLQALSIQQLRSGIQAMESAGVRLGSEARAAIELATVIDENAALNPGLPPAEHARLIDTAILDIANGKIPDDLIYRAPEALPAEVLARAQPEMENLGGVLYAFDPRDILVDARTFQFKGGGDEFGVTDRLLYITEWDPQLAGVVTVYEYADGRLFIADGHQRVALAKRLMAQNPDLKIQLYGYRLREVDGVTPEQAMISAAVTNIAQGTGSIIDAAKIARMDPERFRSMVGRTLPPTSQLVRQAQDMMALTQDAFGAVINEVIPSNYGAIVGRLLADRPELQQAAISVLARAEPANVFQAEAIVRQVREADVDVATQQSLFGEEMVVESLYTERARVLDRAVKTLRQDRAAFANLVRNAENIESAGNVLDRSVNERRADLDGQAIALVQTLANRKGPLSDALSDAARLARDSGSYAAPTRQFVESIRRAIADGDFERIASGEVGRIVNDTPPSRRSEVGKEPSLVGFDEPTGHGPAVEQQADDLTREIFPEPEPVAEGAPVVRQAEAGAEPEVPRVLEPGDIEPDWRPYMKLQEGDTLIPVAQIKPVKVRPEGVRNAVPFMQQAARGEIDKRPALLVRDNGDGTYSVRDGNSTYTIANQAGWDEIPARIVSDAEYATEQARKAVDRIFKQDTLGKTKRRFVVAKDLPEAEFDGIVDRLKDRQPREEAAFMEAATRNHDSLNAAAREAAQELGIEIGSVPVKTLSKITEKLEIKGRSGQIHTIADAARTGITAATIDQAEAFVAALAKKFHLIDEGWSTTPAGYFDQKLIVVFDDGGLGEIQIWPPGMLDAKQTKIVSAHQFLPENPRDLGIGKPDQKDGWSGHDYYDASKSKRATPEMQQEALDRMLDLYGRVADQLDPSFAEKLGIGMPRAESRSAAEAGSSSMVRSPASTQSARPGEPVQPSLGPDQTTAMSELPSIATMSRSASIKNRIEYSYETTGEGQQLLIPGVEVITDIGLMQGEMLRPLRGGEAAMPEGGLFDETARAQQDLFADVNLDEEIPISAIVDPETGEVMAQTMTMRDLKQMLDEEDSFMDRLGYCTR
jgi:hypothetical protein